MDMTKHPEPFEFQIRSSYQVGAELGAIVSTISTSTLATEMHVLKSTMSMFLSQTKRDSDTSFNPFE